MRDTRTGYIVVYQGSLGARYIEVAGFKRFRGMFRNRRVVGVTKAIWTDDAAKARAFASKADAERQIRLAGIPSASKTVSVERVKVAMSGAEIYLRDLRARRKVGA